MRRAPGHRPGELVKFDPPSGASGDGSPGVRVWVKAPSEADKRALHLAVLNAEVDAKTQDARMAALALESVRLGLVHFVDKVENYEGPGGVTISDAASLWEFGELALCREVDGFVASLLTLGDEEKKDSAPSSASTPAVTAPSNGTAEVVDLQALPPSATATAPAATLASST